MHTHNILAARGARPCLLMSRRCRVQVAQDTGDRRQATGEKCACACPAFSLGLVWAFWLVWPFGFGPGFALWFGWHAARGRAVQGRLAGGGARASGGTGGTGWRSETVGRRRDSGQARGGASAHAKNVSSARRDRGVRVASRKRRGRLARASALQARRGEEADGAWNGARDVEFGSARTVQEADV